MRRALSLARKAQGSVSPNPPVGAVVVKDGVVVGEGWTQPPGQAHAEIVAIEEAGGKVTSSPSARTSYLLAGESPGSKHAKARDLGIPIIDEAGLRRLLG